MVEARPRAGKLDDVIGARAGMAKGGPGQRVPRYR